MRNIRLAEASTRASSSATMAWVTRSAPAAAVLLRGSAAPVSSIDLERLERRPRVLGPRGRSRRPAARACPRRTGATTAAELVLLGGERHRLHASSLRPCARATQRRMRPSVPPVGSRRVAARQRVRSSCVSRRVKRHRAITGSEPSTRPAARSSSAVDRQPPEVRRAATRRRSCDQPAEPASADRPRSMPQPRARPTSRPERSRQDGTVRRRQDRGRRTLPDRAEAVARTSMRVVVHRRARTRSSPSAETRTFGPPA